MTMPSISRPCCAAPDHDVCRTDHGSARRACRWDPTGTKAAPIRLRGNDGRVPLTELLAGGEGRPAAGGRCPRRGHGTHSGVRGAIDGPNCRLSQTTALEFGGLMGQNGRRDGETARRLHRSRRAANAPDRMQTHRTGCKDAESSTWEWWLMAGTGAKRARGVAGIRKSFGSIWAVPTS